MSTELKTFAEQLKDFGGEVYVVGGSVRDELLGLTESKDLDLEVFGVSVNFLRDFLKTRFKVDEVGASFGVFKVKMDGLDVDVSMPRRDSKVGFGHKGFDVEVDPNMSVKEACRRRDFTVNAMMKNVVTGELTDEFNGKTDLESGCLRMVDPETFGDDPLRVLRACQLAARFEFTMDFATLEKCKSMVANGDMELLSKERFLEEFRKLFLKSSKPSRGLELAREVGLFHRVFPEFKEMKNTGQEPEWHPENCFVKRSSTMSEWEPLDPSNKEHFDKTKYEMKVGNDVWTHTLLCVDACVPLLKGFNEETKLTVFLATFCHDLGKPETTKVAEDGVVRALGHAEAGVPHTDSFLSSLRVPLDIHEKVLKLVDKHLAPFELYRANVKLGAVRRLARKLFPATIEELCLVAQADKNGRGPMSLKESVECDWLLARASEANVVVNKPLPFVTGKDLLELGFKPGKHFGWFQKLADARRDEDWTKEAVLADFANVSAAEKEGLVLLN